MSDDTLTPQEIAEAAADFKSAFLDADTLLLETVDGRMELLVFEGDDRARLVVLEDLTGLQESNKAQYNTAVDRKSEFRKIASFSPAFLDAYGFQHSLPYQWYYQKQYEGLLLRLAHDSQYRDFRTAPGYFIRKGAS